MGITVGIIASCISVLWVLLEGLLAYRGGMLTVSQMLAKYPGQRGVPFLHHGGMQGDIFIISPLVGLIIAQYGNSWSIPQMSTMLSCGIILSGFMHSIVRYPSVVYSWRFAYCIHHDYP